jgi:hypothetical protein
MPSRTRRYSGSERPAWRMNQIGTWSSTCWRRQPPTKIESARADPVVAAEVGTAKSFHGSEIRRVAAAALRTAAYAHPVAARSDAAPAPDAFRRAVQDLLSAPWRPELVVEEMPAPQRIAPFSAAVTADVVVAGDEVASGRLVLLHDPAGNEAWDGTFRCVTFARADVDPEMVTDPLLAQVGWSWLLDALTAHGAAYEAPSGTVTSVASESFGGMAEEEPRAEIEVRASWTPQLVEGVGLAPHLAAWAELLCTTAGLPPLPAGVVPMPSRRNPPSRSTRRR